MGNRGISRRQRWAPRAEVKTEERQRRRKEAKEEIARQLAADSERGKPHRCEYIKIERETCIVNTDTQLKN
jgi:hypothetical protein